MENAGNAAALDNSPKSWSWNRHLTQRFCSTSIKNTCPHGRLCKNAPRRRTLSAKERRDETGLMVGHEEEWNAAHAQLGWKLKSVRSVNQSHPGSCATLCPLHPVTSKSAKTENRPVVAKGLGERWRDIVNWIGRQLSDKELVGACVQLPGQTKEIPWVGDAAMRRFSLVVMNSPPPRVSVKHRTVCFMEVSCGVSPKRLFGLHLEHHSLGPDSSTLGCTLCDLQS